MEKVLALSITLFCTASFTIQAQTMPSDVKSFQAAAEDCQHFAGEWDSALPQNRQREIERAVDKYCGEARKQQNRLKEKYQGNKDIETLIAEYDI